MQFKAKDRLVCALDVPRLQDAHPLAQRLVGEVGLVKVGLELFVSEGPEVVRSMRALGHEVFLDLKLHDIPNTVRSAARAAGRLGARMLTIHASGGPAMIEAARAGAERGAAESNLPPPLLLAVTVLTSLSEDDLVQVGLSGPGEEAVTRLARLARSHGAGGIVCSPREARAVREALDQEAVIVTPGVRPAGADLDDQARVATPGAAMVAGADYLVIGRPIRQADDPAEAARAIAREVAEATGAEI